MKVSTNVKPKKKKRSSVSDVYNEAEMAASKKYAADSESARKYDQSLKERAKGHTGKTGRVDMKDVAASGSYRGTAMKGYSESARVKGLKETGYYDAKPAVVGGTKKMVRVSKKNVNKSSASKQAKRSAKKLY